MTKVKPRESLQRSPCRGETGIVTSFRRIQPGKKRCRELRVPRRPLYGYDFETIWASSTGLINLNREATDTVATCPDNRVVAL